MQIEYINTNQKPSNLWLLKIIAKIILSRIPMMYQIWQRLGLLDTEKWIMQSITKYYVSY